MRDLRSEFRTRYAVNAILMFALTTLIAVSFSIGAYRIMDSERPFLYAVLLWVILVFSALSGLSRSFVKEQEAGTMDVLKLCARPQAVFLGKLFFNLTLLGALEIIIVPSFGVLMGYPIRLPGCFWAMVISAGLGLGAGTTIVAAMIAQAWVATLSFLLSMIGSALFLVRRQVKADHLALATAELGFAFCILATATGSLFAKVTWGSYWNWDPRETSIVLLLMIYGAYFVLRSAVPDEDKKSTHHWRCGHRPCRGSGFQRLSIRPHPLRDRGGGQGAWTPGPGGRDDGEGIESI